MRLLAIVCALLWTLMAAPAAGQSPTAPDKATLAKFKQAQELYEAKDYAGALEIAKSVVDATGSPNARLYVSRCLRELGKLVEAHQEMSRTLREATELSKTERKYEGTRDSAAAELAQLDQKVAKVVVVLLDAPLGTRVRLNGEELSAAQVGVPVVILPGDLVASARAGSDDPVESRTTLAAGETRTVTLVFKEHAGPVAPPPPPPKQPEPVAKSGPPWRTIGFVTAGVGVVGIGVFAVAGSMSSSKFSEVESGCGGKRCTDPKYADTIDSGKRLETIANVGLVVGALGVLAGGTMILLGGSKAETTTGSPALQVGPRGASLGYARRF